MVAILQCWVCRSGPFTADVSPHMLTLSEVLADVAALPEFSGIPTVDVNTRGGTGSTPLHWMAALGDVVGVDLLVNAGAAIDAVDLKGNTPLHEAVASRQHLVVSNLMDHGASTTLKNALGHTARDLAERQGYAPTLDALENAAG